MTGSGGRYGLFQKIISWLRRGRGQPPAGRRPRRRPLRREPNTTLDKLDGFLVPDVNRSDRSVQRRREVSRLTDDQLRESVLQPADGRYVTVVVPKPGTPGAEGIRGVVRDGNHRLNELRYRVGKSTIRPDEPVYVDFIQE